MTEKLKAIELYKSMYKAEISRLEFRYSHAKIEVLADNEMVSDCAKRHALIAVDEILNILDKEGYDDQDHKIKYWQEVKTEIEKL